MTQNRTRARQALADAHAQIRDLRNQLDGAAQPLRLQLREAEDMLAKERAAKSALQSQVAALETQAKAQATLIDAMFAYHAWWLSSGNGHAGD